MGLSRSARIKILLFIDVAFFLLEIIVGFGVGSLALVADSFHVRPNRSTGSDVDRCSTMFSL